MDLHSVSEPEGFRKVFAILCVLGCSKLYGCPPLVAISNTYSIAGSGKSTIIRSLTGILQNSKSTKDKLLDLRTLRKEVQNSSSDVQRYLNLGWIGVCEVLNEFNWDMVDLIDLWQAFCLFLLRLQHLLLNLEKKLALWEKVLYLLLLYLSFSEFPNRLRPPCTTMPWTIWPALAVLWGVCWMFYEEPMWNWGDQDILPMASNTTGLFEGIDSSDLSAGDFPSPFNLIHR